LEGKKETWQSFLKTGRLSVEEGLTKVEVKWDEEAEGRERTLTSQIAAGGRAMELSDLVVFNGHLLTVDDRTGIIYRIVDLKNVVPWVMLNDGPGDASKGFKAEWMTVKDNQLYVGGLGKEWTTGQGAFVNYHPMYVKIVSTSGAVEHVDWRAEYKKLRAALGIEWPVYVIHESAQWSAIHNKWFFLPRRASKEVYDENRDEYQGSNKLLSADSSFTQPIQVTEVEQNTKVKEDGSKGFSAFQFLPNSDDSVIVALKSQEKEGKAVASYLTVFRTKDGKVMLEDLALKGPYKFEGLAFL